MQNDHNRQHTKREIDDEEERLQKIGIKYGPESFEYNQAAQEFYAKKKQLAENEAKRVARREVSRG
jgi:hypothetical protein